MFFSWGKRSELDASPAGYGYGLPYGTPGGGMPPYTPPPLGQQDDGEPTMNQQFHQLIVEVSSQQLRATATNG